MTAEALLQNAIRGGDLAVPEIVGEVAAATATAYPDDVDRNISSFIARLRSGAP